MTGKRSPLLVVQGVWLAIGRQIVGFQSVVMHYKAFLRRSVFLDSENNITEHLGNSKGPLPRKV